MVVMFDEYWQYKTSVLIGKFAYAIKIDKTLYITGNENIQKRDQNLNLIKQFNKTGVTYRGIYFNKTNDLIYVGISAANQTIDIFDRNLTLIGNINTRGYNPYSIAEYDRKMYVGTLEGSILVIENGAIIHSFTTVCLSISSIMIDSYGYMLVLSRYSNFVYLYHTNGTNLGKEISTLNESWFINFDSNGRLIKTSKYEINIYY
jgi:hypothetical protein